MLVFDENNFARNYKFSLFSIHIDLKCLFKVGFWREWQLMKNSRLAPAGINVRWSVTQIWKFRILHSLWFSGHVKIVRLFWRIGSCIGHCRPPTCLKVCRLTRSRLTFNQVSFTFSGFYRPQMISMKERG